MPKATITGLDHPLERRLFDLGRRHRGRWLATAQAIYADFGERLQSSSGIYEVHAPGSWRYIGVAEQHGHLAKQPGYFQVYRHSGIWPGQFADALALAFDDDELRGTHKRATDLHAAALEATPMVSVVLAFCLHAGLIEWDTTSTINSAARRQCLDAGWDALGRPNPAPPWAKDIFALVLDQLYLEPRPAADYARAYLAARAEINDTLAQQDVRWGGRLLDGTEAAQRTGHAASTWRAYVARGDAPAADEDGRWRPATVDAWRLTRPRVTTRGW